MIKLHVDNIIDYSDNIVYRDSIMNIIGSYQDIYHFDTSHQRKPQGYISNIPWEQVYIMIYPAAMVTSQ